MLGHFGDAETDVPPSRAPARSQLAFEAQPGRRWSLDHAAKHLADPGGQAWEEDAADQRERRQHADDRSRRPQRKATAPDVELERHRPKHPSGLARRRCDLAELSHRLPRPPSARAGSRPDRVA